MFRLSRLIDVLSRFRKDQDGIAALEFAIVLPVMASFLYVSWELSTVYLIKKRTDHAATVLADLTTQSSTMTTAVFNGIVEATEAVLFPFQDRPTRLHVLAVRVDGSRRARRAWERTTGGGTGLRVADLPENLRVANSFYIMTETEITYQPSFVQNMVSDITLRDQAIMVPRLTTAIDNTN